MSSQTISGLFTLLTPVTLARLVLLSDPWLLDMVCSAHISHCLWLHPSKSLRCRECWLSLLKSWRWFIAFNCVSMDQVAMVAIGATMVGSINLFKKEGDTIKKGEQVGICCLYFAIKYLCKSLPSGSPLQGKNVCQNVVLSLGALCICTCPRKMQLIIDPQSMLMLSLVYLSPCFVWQVQLWLVF